MRLGDQVRARHRQLAAEVEQPAPDALQAGIETRRRRGAQQADLAVQFYRHHPSIRCARCLGRRGAGGEAGGAAVAGAGDDLLESVAHDVRSLMLKKSASQEWRRTCSLRRVAQRDKNGSACCCSHVQSGIPCRARSPACSRCSIPPQAQRAVEVEQCVARHHRHGREGREIRIRAFRAAAGHAQARAVLTDTARQLGRQRTLARRASCWSVSSLTGSARCRDGGRPLRRAPVVAQVHALVAGFVDVAVHAAGEHDLVIHVGAEGAQVHAVRLAEALAQTQLDIA